MEKMFDDILSVVFSKCKEAYAKYHYDNDKLIIESVCILGRLKYKNRPDDVEENFLFTNLYNIYPELEYILKDRSILPDNIFNSARNIRNLTLYEVMLLLNDNTDWSIEDEVKWLKQHKDKFVSRYV